jgi:NADPH-dependent 7-cyano-7-deazaguanine reductase QueF
LIDLANHLIEHSKALTQEKEETREKNTELSNENVLLKQKLGMLVTIAIVLNVFGFLCFSTKAPDPINLYLNQVTTVIDYL